MGKRLQTEDLAFKTHESLYQNVAPGVDIQIVENVCEYRHELVKKKLGPQWETKSIQLDPRIFGLPAARARRYIIAWKKTALRWSEDFSLERMLDCLTSQVGMDALKYWWLDLPATDLTSSEVI